ncbi:MAG TPA: sugar transferase [Chthonomonadaceae bacterium]|nr:sugar transferase [Chthonomonadaceae bacterium]
MALRRSRASAPSLSVDYLLKRDEDAPRTFGSAEPSEPGSGGLRVVMGGKRRRVLVVGAGAVGCTLARNLMADGRYTVIGFVDDDIDGGADLEYPLLGSRSTIVSVIEQYRIDDVVLAYAPTWQQQLAEELTVCHPQVCVRIVPSPFEALLRVEDVESFGDIALVRLVTRTDGLKDVVKRALDILLSALGLVVLSPVLSLVALLVKLSSRGPVIFAQERTGRLGKTFVLYKFRTMIVDAETETGPILAKGRNDSRITPLGRWLRATRVDEIPQLWNVLRGDMSLVGPRPERPFFVRQFELQSPAYAQRHQVRPGITGLAQVCGGYHTDARDKLRFDLIYVSHYSVWLDISILLRTLLVVLKPSTERNES